MRKLSLLALVAFVSGAAFAQDAPAVKKTFKAYMDAISGNVIAPAASSTTAGDVTTYSPAGKMWNGNEYEIGLVYSQNWAKAPWLTTSFSLIFVYNPGWDWNTDGTTIARNTFDPSGGYKSLVRGKITLDMTRYFSVYMDSRLFMGFTVQWAKSFGAHGIMLQAGLELFAANHSVNAADYKAMREVGPGAPIARGNSQDGAIIDAFWIDFVWNASMPKGFANSLLFRPVGFGGDNVHEARDGMYIRFQETLSWSNAGFSIYARLRYNIKNIAWTPYEIAGGAKYKVGIVHDLSLRAGISYSYDFSKL